VANTYNGEGLRVAKKVNGATNKETGGNTYFMPASPPNGNALDRVNEISRYSQKTQKELYSLVDAYGKTKDPVYLKMLETALDNYKEGSVFQKVDDSWRWRESAPENEALFQLLGWGALGELGSFRFLGIGSKVEGAGSAVKNGEFSIMNWDKYPKNLPKPNGPFRLIEGTEYDTARSAANQANQANQALHAADPSLKGMQIHEIQPVKFG
jgi:hypothetical protein